ncbi:hypothetical protein KCU61_g800, partial [Aureobasidium melanogenum]
MCLTSASTRAVNANISRGSGTIVIEHNAYHFQSCNGKFDERHDTRSIDLHLSYKGAYDEMASILEIQ